MPTCVLLTTRLPSEAELDEELGEPVDEDEVYAALVLDAVAVAEGRDLATSYPSPSQIDLK